jgi:hypothetical protein
MGHGIIIQLETWQQEMIESVMEKVKAADLEGKPGMALAQVYLDHIDVGYVPHDMAKKISSISRGGVEDEKHCKIANDKGGI